MIRLSSKQLDTASRNHIAVKQAGINRLRPFSLKVTTAASRWDNKRNSRDGKLYFGRIRTNLLAMCDGVELCVYCENNEATDIEHIFPKKLYPEKCFVWANYVLACGNCNTRHKGDKFSIFVPHLSTTPVNVTPPKRVYIKPQNSDALFINPRREDPMNFVKLDLLSGQYLFTEIAAIGTRDFLRAKYTIDLLGLNTRASLIAARRSAVKFYLNRLELYADMKSTNTFQEMEDLFSDDFNVIDQTKTVAAERRRILSILKLDIQSYHHTTIWKELIRQRAVLARTNSLFNRVPEALNW